MTDKEKILDLITGGKYYIPESDYGKAEIWCLHDYYILFEIPMYGGIPRNPKIYPKNKIDEMIKEYESWT